MEWRVVATFTLLEIVFGTVARRTGALNGSNAFTKATRQLARPSPPWDQITRNTTTTTATPTFKTFTTLTIHKTWCGATTEK
jgi:hypothetical protein